MASTTTTTTTMPAVWARMPLVDRSLADSDDLVEATLSLWWQRQRLTDQQQQQQQQQQQGSGAIVTLDWLDVLPLAVSVYCHCWQNSTLAQWQHRYAHEYNAIVLYAHDKRTNQVLVFGVLAMCNHNAQQRVADALRRHCWLYRSELIATVAPSTRAAGSTNMLYPTLESAHFANREQFAYDMCDPEAEMRWISPSVQLIIELASIGGGGGPGALHTSLAQAMQILQRRMDVNVTAHDQLQQAKMRYYFKMCLLSLPYTASDAAPASTTTTTTTVPSIHRETLELGIRALRLWTAALCRLLCPTERHVIDLIRRYRLPFVACQPTATASTDSSWLSNANATRCTCGLLRMPLHAPFGVAGVAAELEALYSRNASIHVRQNELVRKLVDRKSYHSVATALSASATGAQISYDPLHVADACTLSRSFATPTGAQVLYDASIPCSFFVVLTPQLAVTPSVAALFRSVYRFWCSNNPTFARALAIDSARFRDQTLRFSVVLEPLDEQQPGRWLFGVQEWVFSNGEHDLHAFVAAWALWANMQVDTSMLQRKRSLLPCQRFIPHLSPSAVNLLRATEAGQSVGELLGGGVSAIEHRAQNALNARLLAHRQQQQQVSHDPGASSVALFTQSFLSSAMSSSSVSLPTLSRNGSGAVTPLSLSTHGVGTPNASPQFATALSSMVNDSEGVLWQCLCHLDVAEWLGQQVQDDVLHIRTEIADRYHGHADRYMRAMHLSPLYRRVLNDMGSSVLARLQAIVVTRHSRVMTRELQSREAIFHSTGYRQMVAFIKETPERMRVFFETLVAGLVVNKEHNSLRAGGRLVFTIGGRYCGHWKDFGLKHGGGSGHEMGDLIMYHLQVSDPHTAVAWLQRVYDQLLALHQRDTQNRTRNYAVYNMQMDQDEESGGGDDDDDVPMATQVIVTEAQQPPAVAISAEHEREVESARTLIERLLRNTTLVTAGTMAHRYLRVTRGLGADAPTALIEENRALRACKRLVYNFRKGSCEPPTHRPALVCVTRSALAVQRIYLDPYMASKANDLPDAKLTLGMLKLRDDCKDAVPIQHGSDASVMCVVCEGPETALSVACALFDERVPVFASTGIGFIADFHWRDASIDREQCTIVWCRENEHNADTIRNIDTQVVPKTRKMLTRRFAALLEITPPPAYGDFNDIHQAHPGAAGTQTIRACFTAHEQIAALLERQRQSVLAAARALPT